MIPTAGDFHLPTLLWIFGAIVVGVFVQAFIDRKDKKKP